MHYPVNKGKVVKWVSQPEGICMPYIWHNMEMLYRKEKNGWIIISEQQSTQ